MRNKKHRALKAANAKKELFLTYLVLLMPYAHKRVVIICIILGRFQENKSKNQQILSKNRTKMDSPSPLKYRGQTQKMRGIKM